MEHLIQTLRAFDHVLEVAPGPGSSFPALTWGDHFFFYAPEGSVPPHQQPWATIITKDYPDDTTSQLDGTDRWRLNVHVGSATLHRLFGPTPAALDGSWNHAQPDVVLPHPLYRDQGWVCVVTPVLGEVPDLSSPVVALLTEAHAGAQRRSRRRPRA